MVEVAVTPLDDRNAFLERWAALYERAENRTIFLSPPWMRAWLHGAPGGSDLRVVEAKTDEDLLLGVICQLRRVSLSPEQREARLHEFGDEARDAVYIEYNDFLVARGGVGDLRRAAVEAAFESFRSADALVFRNIREELKHAVEDAAAQRGRLLRILREQPVYVADLAGVRADGGDFIASLKASLRAKIRRAVRLYEERGALRCRVASSPQEISAAWDKMVVLHEESWRGRGKTGVFANPQFIAFHDRLRATAPDAFQLMEICAGETTVGVLYVFLSHGRAYGYQSGFFYEKDNRLAPGYVCHALAAQHFLDKGFETYDFLAGDDEYKRRMGTFESTLWSVAVDNPTWRNGLRRLVRR